MDEGSIYVSQTRKLWTYTKSCEINYSLIEDNYGNLVVIKLIKFINSSNNSRSRHSNPNSHNGSCASLSFSVPFPSLNSTNAFFVEKVIMMRTNRKPTNTRITTQKHKLYSDDTVSASSDSGVKVFVFHFTLFLFNI
jgi:hypothetical protein